MTTLRTPFGPGFTDAGAATLARYLTAIADRHRLTILSLLNANGEMTISELVAAIGTRAQPTVSHHVKKLATFGLVHTRKQAVFCYVRLDPKAVAAIASALSPWQAS